MDPADMGPLVLGYAFMLAPAAAIVLPAIVLSLLVRLVRVGPRAFGAEMREVWRIGQHRGRSLRHDRRPAGVALRVRLPGEGPRQGGLHKRRRGR